MARNIARLGVVAVILLLICRNACSAETVVKIPGSSTAYPFITTLAQIFSLAHNNIAVIVESTGTGNGLQLFCSGDSDKYPDLASASRPIKSSEIKLCQRHNINNIIPIRYGYDGIIIANSNIDRQVNISRKELFLALAEKIPSKGKLIKNPFQKWSEINRALPKINIELYGPAGTSGTRDEFNQIIMNESCGLFPEYKKDQAACQTIRNDGKYIEIGNNENLIIQKLFKNNQAFGIIGYNFYQNNNKSLLAVTVDGFQPTIDNIRSGRYPLSRPLFIYAKTRSQNDKLSNSVKLFLQTLTNEAIVGNDSSLVAKGLIPLPQIQLEEMQQLVAKY